MKNKFAVTALVLAVVMCLSPMVSTTLAGEITSQDVTDSEDASLSVTSFDTLSALEVQCGGNGGDALLAGVGTFFIVLIIATAVLAG